MTTTNTGKARLAGKCRQKLRQRLDPLGKFRPQPDPDADRHPYQRGQGDQHDDARQRDQAVSDGADDVRQVQRGREILIGPPGGVSRCRRGSMRSQSASIDARWLASPGRHGCRRSGSGMRKFENTLFSAAKRIRSARASARVRRNRSSIQEVGAVAGGGLLEAEFVGPGHHGAKQQLIIGDDHQQHRQDRVADRGQILLLDRQRDIGADARQRHRGVCRP